MRRTITKMGINRALRASCVLVMVLASTAAASPRPAPRHGDLPTVSLGRMTVVKATAHSRAVLDVPEDVSLGDLTDRVAGGGRVAGYAISRFAQEDEPRFLVQSFIFNRCRRPGCPPAKQPLRVRYSEGVADGVLHAGKYYLYVVADKSEVSITFRDRYLEGHHVERLDGHHADVELVTLPTGRAPSEGGTVFSGGAFTSLEPGEGLGMLGLWAIGSNYLAGAYGNCFYFDRTLAPRDESAFLPGCPTGWSPSHGARGPVPPGRRGGIVYKSMHHRLPVGIGGWAASAGDVNRFGAVALWLRF